MRPGVSAGAVEKERMRDLIGRVAAFCGVKLLTYCILDNHFHLLVEVPGEVGELSDAELIRRAGVFVWGKGTSRAAVDAFNGRRGRWRWAERRGRICGALLIRRMGSLQMFVKVLKQRFSIGYNRLNERKGTLVGGAFSERVGGELA